MPFKKLSLIITTSFFLLFIGWSAHNYSQSERFGDETGNMIGGHFANKGKVLYRDLQLNHQPLIYLFSAGVEKITSPNNLYLYLARQRGGIFVYSALWDLLSVLIFGFPMLMFVVFFEATKYWFSGYKLLGETLAVYPLIYLFASIIKINIFNKIINKKELVIFSFTTFIVAFSLLPLWPTLIFLNVLMIISLKKERYKLPYQLIPFFALSLILFSYIPLTSFIKETIIYNLKYFIPSTSANFSISKFLLPLLAFYPPYSIIKIIIAVLSISILFFTYFFWKKKKFTKWFMILIAIFLTNSRIDVYDFTSFHLLPWYGSLLVAVFLGINYHTQIKDRKYNLTIIYSILIILLPFLTYVGFNNPMFKKQDRLKENYINYSYSETYGKAIKLLKNKDDKLIVIPNDPLVYWVADIAPPTRVLEYYSWVISIPEYRKELLSGLSNNSTAFIVVTGITDIDKELFEVLKSSYVKLKYTNTPLNLYIRKEKYKSINESQWKELNSMHFYQNN